MLAGIGAVANNGAPVEDVVALPPHLDALAKILQALWLAVHGASAGGCPTHAPATQHCSTPISLGDYNRVHSF